MVLLDDIRVDGRVRKEIRTLTAGGHDVELIAADYQKRGAGGEDLGVKIHYVPTNLWSLPVLNFLEHLLFNRKVASMIEAIRPTHIHCHDLTTLLAGTWAKNKVGATLVFDAHELTPERMGGIKEKVWGCIEKSCIKKCDHIIISEKKIELCISRASIRTFQNHYCWRIFHDSVISPSTIVTFFDRSIRFVVTRKSSSMLALSVPKGTWMN
jgi:hypothetical protein